MLLHQFHDIIPGSGIHWVYDDTARDHAHILSAAELLTEDALARHLRAVDSSGKDHPVVVFNALSHPRTELITVDAPDHVTAALGTTGEAGPLQRDAEGLAMFEATVPPCGYRVYDLVSADRATAHRATATGASAGPGHLENEHLRIELDEQGLLSSIFDKSAARQVLAPGCRGNRFQLHPDYPNFFDAWDIDRFSFDQVVELDAVESVDVVEQGPLRAGIRVVRRFGDSHVVQVIRLAARSRYLDFATEVDWQETNRLLKVAFPVDVRSLRATYEIQYGHVERPTHANTSWDVARFEVCAHKWADLSEPGYGVALLNDSKYGYDIAGNVIRLSLLARPDVARPGGRSRSPPFHVPPSPPHRGPAGRRGRRRRLRPECPAPGHTRFPAPGPDGRCRLDALGGRSQRGGRGGQAVRRRPRRAGGPDVRGLGAKGPRHRAAPRGASDVRR